MKENCPYINFNREYRFSCSYMTFAAPLDPPLTLVENIQTYMQALVGFVHLPCIENVLPHDVCPYAKIHPLYPSKTLSTSGDTTSA